jgi:hypothetical protein
MSPRSSIFSFDTLQSVPRPSSAFWLTVVLCLMLRGLMAAGANRLDGIPAHCTNTRLMYIEQTLIRDNRTPPLIALMGNSLMRYGLLEKQVAAAAGVRPEEVINLGVENGSAWGALVLMRRNPQLAASLRLIIYAIQPAEIDRGSRTRWIDSFYQNSTLADRWMEDGWSDRAKLLLDWGWPFHSQRRDLTTWLAGIRGDIGYSDPSGLKPAWHSPLFDRLRARSSKYEQSPDPITIANITGPLSRRHIGHLNDLIALCREHGIRVHFITTPTRNVYDHVINGDRSLSNGLVRFECFLDDLGVPSSRMHKSPLRDRICLDEHADFLDYCHLAPEGASKLTQAVTTDLLAQGVLPVSETRIPDNAFTTAPGTTRILPGIKAALSPVADR